MASSSLPRKPPAGAPVGIVIVPAGTGGFPLPEKMVAAIANTSVPPCEAGSTPVEEEANKAPQLEDSSSSHDDNQLAASLAAAARRTPDGAPAAAEKERVSDRADGAQLDPAAAAAPQAGRADSMLPPLST